MVSSAVKSFGLLAVFALVVAADVPPPGPPEGIAFPARPLPDRIVLTPGADPAHAMAVAYRTDTAETATEAEIAVSLDTPNFDLNARKVSGTSLTIAPDQGNAIYHHVAFDGLSPNTAYAYRVKGSGGWSEWFSFRTAKAGFAPFRFLYFGDNQHQILSVGSRIIRQAFLNTAAPALALHAGDLVNQRSVKAADDEWGEWVAAGGANYAMVPEVPAIGNHEYGGGNPAAGGKPRSPGVLWDASFALPGNGPDPVKPTAYTIQYQGVRFIMLDGTAALEGFALKEQTAWLEQTLKTKTARWTVVMYHQPMFMCSRQSDPPVLQTNWRPLFDRYGVDLVLQGHDHCYARWSNPGSKVKSATALRGPVYLISVAGGKMYGINDKTLATADRMADDTQMYQVIDVAADRLHVQAFTASGTLYDDFAVVRGAKGTKHLAVAPNLPPRRLCKGDTGPDGLPCIAKRK